MKQKRHELPAAKRQEDRVGCVALIFSSDRTFLDYYRKVFLELGFTPITANTCELALGILRLTVVAFIVVDQGGGFFESRRVLERARDTQRHALALVITQKTDPHLRDEAMALGAVDCLNHPVLPDDLVHALITNETRGKRNSPRAHQN